MYTIAMDKQPHRRRRPALACQSCRQRKVKCDRKDPCAHCSSAKTQCTYKVWSNEPVGQPQVQQAGLWASVSSPLVHAASPVANGQFPSARRPLPESVNRSPPALAMSETVGAESDASNAHRRTKAQPLTDAQKVADPDVRDLLQRVQRLERPSAYNSLSQLSQSGRTILEHHTGLQESQIMLNKTRIVGWSRFIGEADEFDIVVKCYMEATGNGDGTSFQDPEIKALLSQTDDLLKRCKQIAKSLKAGRPSRSLHNPEFDLRPPSWEVADTMMNSYFESFESTHRIVHKPTFLGESQSYWRDPESITDGIRLKILLVIAIGSSLFDQGKLEPAFRTTVHQWIYAAQTWLSGPLEKDRLDITGIQVHCLTILARQIFSVGGDLVWMSMGSLIHRAMQMGLHRDPKHLPPMSLLQAEIRRRLWASILELAVQSSLDSGMPPRISPDEFDTLAPSNVNDDELLESTSTLHPHPRDTYTSTSIQLVLHDSFATRLKIVQLLNSLRSELSYVDVLALSSEIMDACRVSSKFRRENAKVGVTPFHGNLLDYLLRRFLIPLHCPFAMKARTNPIFYYSRKATLDAAMTMISPEPDEGFSNLMAIGGGLFREGIRYALTAISIELLAQTAMQNADGTLHRNATEREPLKKAVTDMILLSAERIRQGETNIKSHTFLSMIIGQVEATEAGTSHELKIAQNAKNSAEFCHDLLKARLDSLCLSSSSDGGGISAGFDDGQQGFGMDVDFDWGFEFALPDSGFT